MLTLSTVAQEKNNIKYGKITPDDFKKTAYEQDTSAHAVVLADIGSSEFEADRQYLRLVYKRHKRVKIVDKAGYDEASVTLYLYKYNSQDGDKMPTLKASTYNLENGKVVETKLDSKDIFSKEEEDNWISKKFTLPAVKEGSIIEYTYTTTSLNNFRLRAWDFQGEYPRLWSEYTVSIPEFFDYIFIAQGYQEVKRDPRKDGMKSFPFRGDIQAFGMSTGQTEYSNVSANVSTYRWVAKDVPALKAEPFITTLDNYVGRIDFQRSVERPSPGVVKQVMTTWPKLSEEMMKEERYGAALDKYNGFLNDDVETLTKGATTDEEKARRIYSFIKNNVTCTGHYARYMDKPSLKSVYTGKNGNVVDINLLLVAMLRKAHLTAYPVMLGARNEGYVNPLYPLLDRFNYTIAQVELDGKPCYLDASYPLGFGKLHSSCYNGHARVMDAAATPVSFDADSLLEQQFTALLIMQDSTGMKGTYQQRPTYFGSYSLRDQVRDKGKDEYFKTFEKAFTNVHNTSIEDLDSLDKSVMVKCDFDWQPGEEDMLYINPMFGQATKENPFKSPDRKYPVEMPCTMDEIYTLNLEIPAGYDVEELPKSTMVTFNEDEGMFQYMIAQAERNIQFRCRIKLKRANFRPDEYEALRGFFDMIVKKQGEQIVLKKKA
ncbi:DUF3857 domain-containing protein [Chitinophaga agrisoli]|uniref:DUF3857 domain-containing protein n=1 Tax=Chitinophaga agrisoli TaxID=2607653 RepID=UPI001661C697|nr:DUF3857 domain-containing protein [Chitinophaga agrisoli]